MTKFGQGKQNMQTTQARMTIADFAAQYGKYLGAVEAMIQQVVARVLETGTTISLSPGYDDLKAVMGMKFADEVGNLRVLLFGERTAEGKVVQGVVRDEHKGPFDGYAKRILEDDFGPKSEIVNELARELAPKRGIELGDEKAMGDLVAECDQYDNALVILLPAQARKKEMVQKLWEGWQKYAPEELKAQHPTMPVKSADITEFRKVMAPIVDAELRRVKLERRSAPVAGEAPKRSDFTGDGSYEKYLVAKAAFDSRGRVKSPEEEYLGQLKGAISFLTPQAEKAEREQQQTGGGSSGNGDGNVPEPKVNVPQTLVEQADIDVRAVFETATMKMADLVAKVASIELAEAYIRATTDWIGHLQGEEQGFATAGDYANAGEKQKEWKRLENIELPKLQKKLDSVKASAANAARLQGAAAITAQAPGAKGVVVSPVAETARIKAGETVKETVEELEVAVLQLELKIGQQNEAATKHDTEAEDLEKKWNEAFGRKNVAEVTRLGVLLERERNAANAARAQAESLSEEHGKLVEKLREKKAAKTPATPQVETTPVVVAANPGNTEFQQLIEELGALGEDAEDPELAGAMSRLVTVAKAAMAANRGVKQVRKGLEEAKAGDAKAVNARADVLEALL